MMKHAAPMGSYNPSCWLYLHGIHESGTMPPCDGRLVRCHLIREQVLRKAVEKVAGPVEVRDITWGPGAWVWGCGGPHGNGGHHGMLDFSRRLRIPFDHLPVATLDLADEYGLTWWLERTYK